MDKLKIIKTVVCLLTFLLIFGTLLLFGEIYKKTKQTSPVQTTFSLEQPTGSVIAECKTNQEKLIFLIKNGGLSDRIIIFNPETGKTETTIYLTGKEHD